MERLLTTLLQNADFPDSYSNYNLKVEQCNPIKSHNKEKSTNACKKLGGGVGKKTNNNKKKEKQILTKRIPN